MNGNVLRGYSFLFVSFLQFTFCVFFVGLFLSSSVPPSLFTLGLKLGCFTNYFHQTFFYFRPASYLWTSLHIASSMPICFKFIFITFYFLWFLWLIIRYLFQCTLNNFLLCNIYLPYCLCVLLFNCNNYMMSHAVI